MRLLLISEEQRSKIAQVTAYADLHPFPKVFMREREKMQDAIPPAGANPNHVCHIPQGFRCVYTIEEQPVGWCRHLSVSVDDPEKMPSIEAIEVLILEFGFTGRLRDCYVYMEEDISPKAVNIIQKK